jgi:formylmethanofuran dehydrogenase subunit C
VSALTFSLKAKLLQRVDCSALTPDGLRGKTGAEIERIPLPIGNTDVAVAEIFKIKGRDSNRIIFSGDSTKLDRIGAAMTGGEIVVEETAGDYLGLGMKGGVLLAEKDVGIFAACEIRGGELHINGNAGDFVGGGLPGERRGMFGGTVVIGGNAGARVGDQMRRGMILVAGNTGDYLGSRMSGGTIVVIGNVGANAGFAMKRGTLMLTQLPNALPPTFNDCGVHPFGFLALLMPVIHRHGKPFSNLHFPATHAQRWMGDVANIGRGEILIPW